MYVLITCKFKGYLTNSNKEKIETSIFQTVKGSLLEVSGQILVTCIMHVLDTYKFKMDWINTKQEKMETSIFQTLNGQWAPLFFATHVVQFFFLNPKFHASSFILSLHSPVCVRPGMKPRISIFSEQGQKHY